MMQDAPAPTTAFRPAEDIAADIASLVRAFPPLVQSRHWFAYTVAAGVVTITGHIKSPVAERVLLDNVPDIPGVLEVDTTALYNDDDLRRDVGKVLPPGVWSAVNFGAVALTGSLPAGVDADTVVKTVLAVPGVRTVEANFMA